MRFLRIVAMLLAAGMILAGLGSTIMAADETKGSQDSAKFEQVKAKITASLDARIKLLQDEKACVSAAKTNEDLKKCRQSAREERKAIRKEMKGQMKGGAPQGTK